MREFRILLGSASLRQWLTVQDPPLSTSWVVEGIPKGAEFVRFEVPSRLMPDRDHIDMVFRYRGRLALSTEGYFYPKFEGKWLAEATP